VKERKNIECPIQPAPHLMPILELVVGFSIVDRFDSPGLESITNLRTSFRREGEGHGIWINIYTYDRDDRSEDLFLEFVRNRKLIPEQEKKGLMMGERDVV
jgi:hypothetical protein